MSTLVFEKIDSSNADKVVEIYNYYVLNTTASYCTDALNAEEMIAYYQIDAPLTKSFAIRVDDEVAGFVVLKPWNAKKLAYKQTYELTIYIKKEYCKQGIGSKTVEFIENQIKDDNIAVIMAGLSCDNIGSRKLLESTGFVKCGQFEKIGKKFGKYLDILYYQKTYPDKFEEID